MIKNTIYTGANNRASLLDLELPKDDSFEDVVIFIHGYKGYKDWGAWPLVQSFFVKNNIAFCKFNLSHNGGTVENPIDFPDLNAFSNNKYSYELEDVKAVLNWLEDQGLGDKKWHLIGHSRGGGIAILSAVDKRISTVTTWASIADIGARFPKGEQLEKWKKEGVYTVKNGRTLQEMPQNYCIYEDWLEHREFLDIKKVASHLPIKALHIHGEDDPTVNKVAALKLQSWTEGRLCIIPGANHTFNSYHPYSRKIMPKELMVTCRETIDFILE